MTLREALDHEGMTIASLRVWSVVFVAVVLVATVLSVLVPPTIERGHVFELYADGAMPEMWIVLGLVSAAVLSGYAGFVLGTRVFEGRWPWPFGPRNQNRRKPSRASWVVFMVVLLTMQLPGRWLVGQLPSASGNYSVTDDVWLRLIAPADIGLMLVASMTLAFALSVLASVVLVVWRMSHPPAAQVGPAAPLAEFRAEGTGGASSPSVGP